MSRRRSSASGTRYCICLLPLPAIRGPGDALGLDTISGLVVALVPISFSGPGAALGSMPYLIPSPVMVMRLYLCASPFQVRPSSLLLSLVLVRPLTSYYRLWSWCALCDCVSAPGKALGLVSFPMKPLCPLLSLALVWPSGVLPSLLMVRPKCPLPLLVLI